MGQEADSNRNAALDDQKRRAAGRGEEQNSPEGQAIKDFHQPLPAKGQTGGAFGRDDVANRPVGSDTEGGGGGGGSQSTAKD